MEIEPRIAEYDLVEGRLQVMYNRPTELRAVSPAAVLPPSQWIRPAQRGLALFMGCKQECRLCLCRVASTQILAMKEWIS